MVFAADVHSFLSDETCEYRILNLFCLRFFFLLSSLEYDIQMVFAK